MHTAEQKYLGKLKKAKLSNTTPRTSVFVALFNSNHEPLTMDQLIEKCSGLADRASVYRAVEVLEKINVINKIHTGWKYKLELSDEFHGHHHHLICIKCHGIVIAKNNLKIEKEITDLGKEKKFKIKEHSLEIYGLCRECYADKKMEPRVDPRF